MHYTKHYSNFITFVMRLDHDDDIGKIWNEIENIYRECAYRDYKTFNASYIYIYKYLIIYIYFIYKNIYKKIKIFYRKV